MLNNTEDETASDDLVKSMNRTVIRAYDQLNLVMASLCFINDLEGLNNRLKRAYMSINWAGQNLEIACNEFNSYLSGNGKESDE